YNGPGLVQRDPLAREYYQFLFQVHEKDLATYLQADFKGTGWAGNIGVRVVNTDENVVTYSGQNVSASTPGAVLTSLFGPFVGLPVSHTYKIGRASCRERVKIRVAAVEIKKKSKDKARWKNYEAISAT